MAVVEQDRGKVGYIGKKAIARIKVVAYASLLLGGFASGCSVYKPEKLGSGSADAGLDAQTIDGHVPGAEAGGAGDSGGGSVGGGTGGSGGGGAKEGGTSDGVAADGGPTDGGVADAGFDAADCTRNPEDNASCPWICPEACDGKDNDCDGVTDNPDQVCDLPNAEAGCEQGQCVIKQCAAPYDDCNGVVEDGCETSLNTLTDCGVCDVSCGPLSNATATCATGICEIAGCNAGYYDCDGNPANGCESTVQNCFPYTVSNVDASQWDFSNSPTWNCTASGTTTVDSSAGTVTSTSCALGTLDISNNVAQLDTSGPNVMVIRLKGLTISNSHVLKLKGDKPIIFLAYGNVVVDSGGKIDVGATSTTAGPGGSIAGQCAGQTGGNGSVVTLDGGGGGGGGFGTAGGRGAKANGQNGSQGSAGAVSADTDLQPLRGGCSGGLGSGKNYSSGGAGGGAFQISASGTITIGTGSNAANVSANGGGGEGQPNNSNCVGDGGDGGGSGGGILLEAKTTISFGTNGAARAHGGGGSGGTECLSSSAGQDGHQTDNTKASGGAGEASIPNGGAGGLCAGANCASSSADGTQAPDQAAVAGGGGGGGGGRIVVLVH